MVTITPEQAAEALYAWLAKNPFLVRGDSALNLDPALERAAASVLHDVAEGRAQAWATAPAKVRGLAAALVVDFMGKLIGEDPSFRAPLYLVPASLNGAPLGAWILAREIERSHPWIASPEGRH